MTNRSRFPTTAAILILHVAFTAALSQNLQTQTDGQSPKPVFSTPEELKEELDAVPCKGNSERLKAVQALFEKLGAPASNISIEKTASTKNIIIRKPGSSSEIIVVGAHYDKVSYGCGAVDKSHFMRFLFAEPIRTQAHFWSERYLLSQSSDCRTSGRKYFILIRTSRKK